MCSDSAARLDPLFERGGLATGWIDRQRLVGMRARPGPILSRIIDSSKQQMGLEESRVPADSSPEQAKSLVGLTATLVDERAQIGGLGVRRIERLEPVQFELGSGLVILSQVASYAVESLANLFVQIVQTRSIRGGGVHGEDEFMTESSQLGNRGRIDGPLRVPGQKTARALVEGAGLLLFAGRDQRSGQQKEQFPVLGVCC